MTIKIQSTEIKLNTFEVQYNKNNQAFKLVHVHKVEWIPVVWINKEFKNHWNYIFKYEDGRRFEVEIDYYDTLHNLKKNY